MSNDRAILSEVENNGSGGGKLSVDFLELAKPDSKAGKTDNTRLSIGTCPECSPPFEWPPELPKPAEAQKPKERTKEKGKEK